MTSSDRTDSVRQQLQHDRSAFEEGFAQKGDPIELCHARSDRIDEIVRGLCASSETKPRFCVLALGGYGRQEMGLHCDIDLLFLHDGADDAAVKAFTDGVLYPFWNNGIEVGGATRSLADCRRVIGEDVRALTAMMEARLIFGDESLFSRLKKLLHLHLSDQKNRRRYVTLKLDERQQRFSRFGDSIYLLQPHLKEGEGGLRDYHDLLWIGGATQYPATISEVLAHALRSARGRDELSTSLRFLWRVRHGLHLIRGTRADRLEEGVQAELAQRLGYSGVEPASPTEALMSDYYRHALTVHRICAWGIERLRREIIPSSRWKRLRGRRRMGSHLVQTEYGTLAVDEGTPLDDPLTELRLFAVAKRAELALDPAMKDRLVHEAARTGSIDDERPEAHAIWQDILGNLKHLDRTLADMIECGTLVRWFPEMAPMLYRVQHDGYHFFTAGVHSIKAIGEITRLAAIGRKELPVPFCALRRIKRQHVLALATLLHDVGKGREGKHHLVGAKLAADICTRIGFSERDTRDVVFLVRSHLLMAKLAFRRDIRDPELIARFSQSMRTPELLAMLYLLTVADIRAVGPNIWSSWKGGLLADLYQSTHAVMTGVGSRSERTARDRDKRLRLVKRRLGRDVDARDVTAFIAKLPERYLAATRPETIAAHMVLAQQIQSPGEVATTWEHLPEASCTELTVVTADAPGLFAMLAGVLTVNGANIIEAQLFTNEDGLAVDVFRATDPLHKPLVDPERWQRIRTELQAVIGGEMDIERIVGTRFKRRLLSWANTNRPSKVAIDNDVSATETVVEISTDDRLGLLYAMAQAIHAGGFSIDRARITTHIDRVIDVFYIRDANGAKVESADAIEGLRRNLLEAVET